VKNFVLTFSRVLTCTFLRRSLATPPFEHPRAEEDLMQEMEAKGKDQSPGKNKELEAALGRALEEAESNAVLLKQIYDLLSDEPILIDTLCVKTGMTENVGAVSACLTMLELQQLARINGIWCTKNMPEKAKKEALFGCPTEEAHEIEPAVEEFFQFIRSTFCGISRKYSQLYLAYWWYIKNCGKHTMPLINEYLRFGAIDENMLRDYVTPLTVKLAT
jgi:hypothetical protein